MVSTANQLIILPNIVKGKYDKLLKKLASYLLVPWSNAVHKFGQYCLLFTVGLLQQSISILQQTCLQWFSMIPTANQLILLAQ